MDADEAIIRGGVWCLIGRGAAHRMRGASTYNLLPVFGKMSVSQEQSPYQDRLTN